MSELFPETYERFTKQEIVSFNNFVKRELKKLEKKGYTIEEVRMKGSWMTFHIKKKSDIPFASVLTSVDLIYKPASARNWITIQMRDLKDETYNYSYKTFTKFKKGFIKNVINRYLKR